MGSESGPTLRSRADGNQAAIIRGLRDPWLQHRLSVAVTTQVGNGFPDVVMAHQHCCAQCGAFGWRNLLVEIKQPGADVRPGTQSDFHRDWRGPIAVVSTLTEALQLAGIKP